MDKKTISLADDLFAHQLASRCKVLQAQIKFIESGLVLAATGAQLEKGLMQVELTELQRQLQDIVKIKNV